MTRLQLSPSILTADFAHLADELRSVAGQVDWFHLDVMDGHYVENITFGPDVVAAIAAVVDQPLHVHLMIQEPGRYAQRFVDAGVRRISFHPEVVDDPGAVIDSIVEAGCGAGLAVHPDRDLTDVKMYLDRLEVVLVMTVRPGFGGQAFLDFVVPKIAEARDLVDAGGFAVDVEVDGGVNLDTIDSVVRAGANVLVAGSAVFDGKDARAAAIALRERLDRLEADG